MNLVGKMDYPIDLPECQDADGAAFVWSELLKSDESEVTSDQPRVDGHVYLTAKAKIHSPP